MGARATALADQLEQAIAEFAKTVEGCSDATWGATCGAEGWTVAVTAQHVAGQFPLEREFIEAAAEGRDALAYTWDDINGKNDRRAAGATTCTKAEVLALLSDGGPAITAYVRGLSDAQLDSTAPLTLAGGAALSAEALITGGVLIEHITGHTASIREAR